MSQVQGVVEAISSKQVNTSRGVSTSYSLKVGSEWYSTFRNPACNKGDTISFNMKLNKGFKNVDGNVTVLSGGAQPAAVLNQPDTSRTWSSNKAKKCSCGKFPMDVTDGDMAISRRHAVSAAIDLVKAIPITTKGKQDPVDLIIEMADKIVDYTTGQRELQNAVASLKTLEDGGVINDTVN